MQAVDTESEAKVPTRAELQESAIAITNGAKSHTREASSVQRPFTAVDNVERYDAQLRIPSRIYIRKMHFILFF